MEWRCEAWTLPGSATFELIVEVPLVAATLNDTNQPWGTGSISTPANFEYVSLVADVEPETPGSAAFSLLRFFRPAAETPDFEFYADEATRGLSDDGEKVYQITGRDIRSGPDDGIVYEKVEWGSDENLLQNPGFEDNTVTPKSFHLVITATSGSFTLNDGTDTTSAIAYNADAATIHTRIQTDLGLFNDVIVVQIATSPLTFLIEMVDPAFGVNLGISAGDWTTTTIVEGGLSPAPWTKVMTLASGLPEQGNYDQLPFVSAANPDTGDYSLHTDPGPVGVSSNRNAGNQQVASVTPGIHQASIRVRPTSASDPFRLGIFGVGEEVIAWNDVRGDSFTANTYSTISLTDFDIPAGNPQIIFRLACTKLGPSDPSGFDIDNAALFAGFAAEPAGVIVSYLIAAAQARGTLTWLDISTITATTDSNGTAWPQDESFSADRGQQIASHVIAGFMALEYEFDVVPKATPSGGFTHDLKMFVPGGRDNEPNIGVFTGLFTGGTITKRRPLATHVLVEDVNQNTIEVTDAAFSAVPRRESFIRAEFAADLPTAGRVGTAALNDDSKNLVALQANIVPDVVAYQHVDVGDTVPWTVLGDAEKHDRRIATITLGLSSGESGKVWSQEYTASRVFAGEAAMWESFRILFSEWRRKQAIPGPSVSFGGKGGEFSISIAAYNALPEEKAKADFVCLGVADQETINTAWSLLDQISSFAGGRLVFSSGDFHLSGGISIDAAAGSTAYELVGVGSRGGGHSTTLILDVAIGGTNPRMVTSDGNGSTTFRNLCFNGNGKGGSVAGIWSLSAGSQTVIDCTFFSLETGVFSNLSSDQASRVLNNWFDSCGRAIRVGNGAHIIGNHIEDCTGTATDFAGIRAVGSSTPGGLLTIIANNTIINGDNFGIITGGWVHCINNHIRNNNADSGILVQSGGGKYLGNTIALAGLHGIEMEDTINADGGIIAHNDIDVSQQHGIYVRQAGWRVFDNIITGAGQAAANTYDGIHTTKDAIYVSRNTIDGDSGQTRYGINVASGTGSIVVANDLKAAADYGTGAFNDSGTSTVTTFPAGAVGDNFST